jgi:hypothetical protein
VRLARRPEVAPCGLQNGGKKVANSVNIVEVMLNENSNVQVLDNICKGGNRLRPSGKAQQANHLMPRLLSRLPQRTQEDCVICVVAMIMGYSYKRVLRQSGAYPETENGKFFEWWVGYMQDEGYRVTRQPFMSAYDLWKDKSGAVGMLGMTIEHEQRRHVAAIDAAGVVDPASGAPDHIHLAEYIVARRALGIEFDSEFLLVTPGVRRGATVITRLRRLLRRGPPSMRYS